MYGFEGVGLSEVQLSISELSVVGGGGAQTHFMVGPSQGPTKSTLYVYNINPKLCPKHVLTVREWL